MKAKPLIASGVGAAFGVTIVGAPYHHHDDGGLHLPPGNAPIAVALASAASTATTFGSLFLVLPNAIHDAEYVTPPNTKPLKSDGQTEKA